MAGGAVSGRQYPPISTRESRREAKDAKTTHITEEEQKPPAKISILEQAAESGDDSFLEERQI